MLSIVTKRCTLMDYRKGSMNIINCLVLLCVQYLSCINGQADPCFAYTNLSDTTLRTDYTLPSDGTTPTVSLLNGWYRYTSTISGIVATGCPAGTQCGASQQVWVNDQLPVASMDIVTLAVCIRRQDNCCALQNSMQVKNCNLYYVYKLSFLPPNTHYCFNDTASVVITLSTFSTSKLSPTVTSTQTHTLQGNTPSTSRLHLVSTTATQTLESSATTMSEPQQSTDTTVPIKYSNYSTKSAKGPVEMSRSGTGRTDGVTVGLIIGPVSAVVVFCLLAAAVVRLKCFRKRSVNPTDVQGQLTHVCEFNIHPDVRDTFIANKRFSPKHI